MLTCLIKFYREAEDGVELLLYPLDGDQPPRMTEIQYVAPFFDETDEEEKDENKDETDEEKTKEENKDETNEEEREENKDETDEEEREENKEEVQQEN